MLRLVVLAFGILVTTVPAFAALDASADAVFLRNDRLRPGYVGIQYAEKYKWKEKYKCKGAEKYEWKGGGCKYEYKADKKGFKEKYKCK